MVDFEINLRTDNFSLRPLLKSDYSSFSELTANPEMWTWFTHDLSVKEELEKWIETALSEGINKTRLAFTMIDESGNVPVGSTSLGNISYRDKRAEIGWTWIGEKFQGKGINDTSKFLLFKYCFENLGFERVECKTDVLNIPARKALVRIGMTEEGVLRSHTLMTHNRRRDTIYYSVLKSEWEMIKEKNHWI